MATSSRKPSSRRGGKTKKERMEEMERQDAIRTEIILWVVVAVALLLFISNFGVGGVIGRAISGFLFGVFGLMEYVVPVLLIVGSFFVASNRGNSQAVVKIIAAVVFVLFFCMIISLIVNGSDTLKPIEAFKQCSKNRGGGGILGCMLAYAIVAGFGLIGAYIVGIVAIIIAVLLFTGRSLMRLMKRGGQRAYDSAVENSEQRREYREYRNKEWEQRREEKEEQERQRREEKEELEERRREEREKRRLERKISGVSADTEIKRPRAGASDDMEEIYEGDELASPESEKPEESVAAAQPEEAAKAEETVDEEPRILFGGETRSTAAKTAAAKTQTDAQEQNGPELPPLAEHKVVSLEPVITGNYADEPVTPSGQERAEEFTDSEIESLLASSVQDIVTGADESLAGDGMQELNQDLSFERAAVEPTAALGGAAGADLDPAGSAPVPGAAGDPASPAPARSAQTASAVGAAVPVPGAAPLNAAPPSAVKPEPPKEYVFPTVDLLAKPKSVKPGSTKQQLMETANKLQEVLSTFGVNVTVTDISCGPAVTRYEVQPEMGVKVSKIVGLADDIKLNLAAPDVRIEAPIPGKAAVGIEVPNKENVAVPFRELVGSEDFKKSKSKVSVALGKDIGGNIQIADIAKMPHVLIAGATGSGKSVCINSIIMSILYKATPEEVKLIMIDPKVVELSVYNGIPHLLIPVVTDPKKASGALNWAVAEMTERYEKFAEANVREINGYNEKIASIEVPEGQQRPKPMEQIVIIVDELADLMMVASGEVEEAICRLAQLARAAGIHLIIATQRPSVNVITGLIKANMPSRIAFAVTSGIDSRTILDMNGAEKLLGKGDMLYYPQGIPKPIRVQGAFVSDKEVGDVVAFIKEQNGATVYSEAIQQKVESAQSSANVVSIMDADEDDDGRDAYFSEAAHVIVDKEKASIGMLQRYLKIGFNRAARIMDQLEEAGVVGPEEGTKPRKVTMTPEELEAFLAENE